MKLKLRCKYAYHWFMAGWQNWVASMASEVMRSVGAASNKHEAAMIDTHIEIIKPR
ncbi:MAG: hypothetical protein Q8L60_10730 [Gammaproteobacteria bacterium]|nr:hypothetical protein [Gammaproteobacteria bacterium]MDP2346822.1 hypothetical protein [Gammaproteobacteria bacterium]